MTGAVNGAQPRLRLHVVAQPPKLPVGEAAPPSAVALVLGTARNQGRAYAAMLDGLHAPSV